MIEILESNNLLVHYYLVTRGMNGWMDGWMP